MSRTVDLVIVGLTAAGTAAAIDAARQGRRVLVVEPLWSPAARRRLRRAGTKVGRGLPRQVSVVMGVDVVCVDGANCVEAVVMRHVRTGRLVAVNASDILVADVAGGTQSAPGSSRHLTPK